MKPEKNLDEESAEVRLALFDFAFTHAPIGVAIVDVEGRILRANDAFSKLVGISHAALHQTPFAEFTHPDDLEADLILFREVLAGMRDGYKIEKRYVRPDGRIVEVIIHIAAMRDSSGKVIRFLSQIEDITVHKEHERQLAEKAAQLQLAMEAVRGGFWHMDVATETFETSDRLAAFIGGPEAARLDLQRYLEKVNPEDSLAADLTPLLSGAVEQSVAEYRLDTVFGEKWMRCDRRLVRDPNGKPRRIVGVAIDFTDEHRRLEASERNAESDALTGFLNRRGLANRYGRMTTSSGIGVLAIDLDGFKQVNDTLGHPAGDAVLEETARRLRLCIRQTDLAARFGGDEFVLVIAGDRQAVEDVAERAVLAMRQTINLGEARADVRVTVGGIWSDAKVDLARLVSQADAILYSAKARGKDRWAVEIPQ
ncbi:MULTISPECIES: diguanylate cyclase domain-containing protein [unclassified Rhizobium]|uniref:diguanylate cyclase domain-containing protein n=1 Tax=unclassified Rhizobium TaxID=2613769 RepID=UPI0028891A9E|nr:MULTISPECIES: diguanylate cyclase [unclassified Rhizobium]